MCGIAGIIAFTEKGKGLLPRIEQATACLKKRGPDAEGILKTENVAFGHRRLSIIDTSPAGNQPMSDPSGRYTIIFNGEFFNYQPHRKYLLDIGIPLTSESDTEVLLNLFILEGPEFLKKVNGFFGLAILDKLEQKVFIARDRVGVKPLYYFINEDNFVFGSELRTLLAAGLTKTIDHTSLFQYLQLNYIPGSATIFEDAHKLEPGTFAWISASGDFEKKRFYDFPRENYLPNRTPYIDSIKTVLDSAVQQRLIADVPLGCFLSGGIDSSIITGIASKHVKNLKTFSVGFKDEPHFDETQYASICAKMFKTEHTVFSVSNDDLIDSMQQMLGDMDEPFADSSALAVNLLCRKTRDHVTVALSGDGADELFGGYNKHGAEWFIRNNPLQSKAMRLAKPLFSLLPQSRNSKFSNVARQLNRFAEGAGLERKDRYWRWCGFVSEGEAQKLLVKQPDLAEHAERKNKITEYITEKGDMNDVLLADTKMVLTDDMLVKVDRMSMANSLEVRSPFLDLDLLNIAFSIPENLKITKDGRKIILKEAFKDLLPDEILNRSKKGFEVPLLNWFRNELKSLIADELLNDDFIREQKIFNPEEIKNLKIQLFSLNPGEIHARIYGLIVFQKWYKNWMLSEKPSH